MTLLDVSGSGLFSNSCQFLHIIGEVLKLAAGSLSILLVTIISFIVIVICSFFIGIRNNSLTHGFWSFMRLTGYLVGIAVAMAFVLIAALFTGISLFKLLVIAITMALIVSFVVREAFLFFVFKRFGKYILYFATLRRISKIVIEYGEEKNQNV